ncbi:hypothetical protein [Streptomyces sp. NPDC004728]|uniref:hypothetical protein n=1 Tax=Streptomyces sp. NPDC004728 TaxID=3154289 RepID=UPI0033AE2F76
MTITRLLRGVLAEENHEGIDDRCLEDLFLLATYNLPGQGPDPPLSEDRTALVPGHIEGSRTSWRSCFRVAAMAGLMSASPAVLITLHDRLARRQYRSLRR